ncbi:MAG TPA: DedA family protein [Bacteroidales bacterium]|nr:DedA family protein [Bacteroidales bacterium]
MIEFADWGYYGLFLASFLAATVVPFSSEVVFSAMVFSGLNAWKCVLVATAGNWLGGMTSYYIGRLGKLEWIERFFRIKKEKIDRFLVKFQRFGDWFVFFSFVPFIGDVIAVAAGFFRGRWWVVAIAMLLGKFVRYVVWMYVNDFIL